MDTDIQWIAERESMDRREFEVTDVWLQRLQSSHRHRFTGQRKQRREFGLTDVWLQRLQSSHRHWFTVQRKQQPECELTDVWLQRLESSHRRWFTVQRKQCVSWLYGLRSSAHIEEGASAGMDSEVLAHHLLRGRGAGVGTNTHWIAEQDSMYRQEFEPSDVWLRGLLSSHRYLFTEE